ncbi:MAG: dioxygenase, partial [Chloroflexi bacterium]|nr:dioxygenase [Chloroflexota bacterium]
MVSNKKRIVYFSHGGGPLPLLGDPGHKAMIEFMNVLPELIERPDLILVISAHWEEAVPTLLGSPNPPMFYDYYGFPPETYEVQYPAPGAPEKAAEIAQMLGNAGIPARINQTRGYDHGHFIPLLMMYPQANIPTLQLSLVRGLDPEQHLQLGEALRPLLDENILVIGSGFSFHNMSAFSWHA